mgnify:CR=1 FL=1
MGAALQFFPVTSTVPTKRPLVFALGMWASWHLDEPPYGSTGNFATDRAIADAFRMMIYLRADDARMDWLYRELGPYRLCDGHGSKLFHRQLADPLYASVLIEWWLELFEAKRAALFQGSSG